MDDGPDHVAIPALSDPPAPVAAVGGKGAALMRLVAAGFPVPPGFVVPTSCFEQPVDAAILAAYHRLGSPAVAVRSSAVAEDSEGASYAGQLDSFLNVSGDAGLLDAVRRCWASLHTERADAYRARRRAETGSMAVVVQQMVPAEAAGVVFTADPVSGDSEVVVINATSGLGEGLVSGDRTPDSWHLSRPGLEILARRAPADPPPLTDEQARRLAGLCLEIEVRLGSPMDIEWCRVADALFIVQARPITTHRSPTAPDPWNDSRTGDFLWTSTNAGEAIPDVMTPATWSMVEVFMHDAMATASVPPYLGYGRIGGRAYLNVSVMLALAKAFGVPQPLFLRLTAQVFGRLPAGLEIPRMPASRMAILRGVLPLALHVIHEARRDVTELAAYLDRHPDLCARRLTDIAGAETPGALARLWTETVEPEFHHASWMLSAATRSSGLSFVLTGPRLERLVGPAAANALTGGLASPTDPLASLGLVEGLDQLVRGDIDRETFSWRYGHRGPHEFEISMPRPGEDPAWLDRQLAERGSEELVVRLARVEREREAAWADLRSRHPWQVRLLRRQVRRWAAISRNRELARGEVIRYFWVLRAYALRAGELTGLGSDIFFCEGPEIQRALQGETISPTVVAERRAAYEGYCRLPAYPVLIRGPFDPYAWAADPDRRSDLSAPEAEPSSETISGFGGSAGVVTGRVRVLVDPAEGAELVAGEVLVARVTNVGWTPLFDRCAAIVTDVGAPLSHAAIVAREMGIPAVVGCGNATMRLRTGDLVRVDGSAGTVTPLP